MHGVWENGLHHRLLQRVDPGPGARVVPLLERVQVGEHELRRRSALVQIRREADLVADLSKCLREDGWEGMTRVRPVDEQQCDLARAHIGREIRDLLERARAFERVIGPELHGLADLTRDRKSTRLNSSHVRISYAVFCLKRKKT